jgi:hypothetical protein
VRRGLIDVIDDIGKLFYHFVGEPDACDIEHRGHTKHRIGIMATSTNATQRVEEARSPHESIKCDWTKDAAFVNTFVKVFGFAARHDTMSTS